MERFKAFSDAAIIARLERLDRAETALQQTMAKRISQVEAEGRWLRSDPVFQQLSSALKRVRSDMCETEEELMRRGRVATVKKVA